MSPRPYKLGQRQAVNEQTRLRILNAARDLLLANDGGSAFSLDAIARRADVARMIETSNKLQQALPNACKCVILL